MAYKNATPKVWYQIQSGESWLTCQFVEFQPDGSVWYQLPDGTKGTAAKGMWRIKPAVPSKSKTRSAYRG